MIDAHDGPAIWAHDGTKGDGKLTAVDHVDMNVPSGGVFGLLGLNGAGGDDDHHLTGSRQPPLGRGSDRGRVTRVRCQPMEVKAPVTAGGGGSHPGRRFHRGGIRGCR